MTKKPFVDTRVPALQQEFPRTHADAFAERQTEGAWEHMDQKMQAEAAQAGKLSIKGAEQAGILVKPEERQTPYENVIPLVRSSQ